MGLPSQAFPIQQGNLALLIQNTNSTEARTVYYYVFNSITCFIITPYNYHSTLTIDFVHWIIGHWKFLEETGNEIKAYDWTSESYDKFKNTLDENYTTGKVIY